MLGFDLLRPMLHRLDAETAHRLTIAALRSAPLRAPPRPDPRLACRLFGLDFPSPLGLAAGFDKDAEVFGPLLRLGFGFVEIGGVTPEPQPGNPRPRAFRLARDRAVINRYGLNSAGAAVVADRLARRSDRHGHGHGSGIVGVNIGANKDAKDRTADYVTLVSRFAGLADYLSVNISSPNTPGLRDLQGRAALDGLLARIMETRAASARPGVPVLVKIAPDIGLGDLDDMIDLACAHGVDGLIVSNTTTARPASLQETALARETGGLSGRPLFERSTALLAEAFLRLDGRLPLIGVGGIDSPAAAIAKIEAGASLLQLYSALVYDGPALIGRIHSGIAARLAADGLSSPLQLTGSAAKDWAGRFERA